MFLEISNPIQYRAACYGRLSLEDNQSGLSQSLENQCSLIEEYAKKNNITIVETYLDDGYTGTNFDRPGFQKMIKDIESGKINMVITKDLSRIGREYIQTGHYLEKYFPEHKVRYISLLDGIDTGIDSSINDITPFKALLNDMYSKDISKKIKSVKHDRMRQGLFMAYVAPYGYKKHPDNHNQLIIDEDTAWVIRRIFDMTLEGKTPRNIAEQLSIEKIQTPLTYHNFKMASKDGNWARTTVKRILTNQIYIGNLVQGQRKKINYKSKKIVYVPEEQWIIVENTHEPIIDKDDFDKVQLILEKRSTTRVKTLNYLLKGLLVCHDCGHKIGLVSARCRDNKPRYYTRCNEYSRSFSSFKKCSNHSMIYEDVESQVIATIRDVCHKYLNKDYLKEIASKTKAEIEKEKRQYKDLSKKTEQLNEINQVIDKIYDDKLNGLLSYDDFVRIYEKKQAEKKEIESKIDYFKQLTSDTSKEDDSNTLNQLVDDFIKMESPSRELLFSLIDRIELTEEKEILIFFRFRLLDKIHNTKKQA